MAKSYANMDFDKMLIPSLQLRVTVAEALETVARLCLDMRECESLSSHLLDHLLLLRRELNARSTRARYDYLVKVVQFANTLGLVVLFLKKYAAKNMLQRLAATTAIRVQARSFHHKIDDIFGGLARAPNKTEWQQQEAADVVTQRDYVARKLSDTPATLIVGGTLTRRYADSSLEEALLELKDEISNQQHPEDFVKLAVTTLGVVAELTGTTIPDLPVWYIRRNDIEVGELIDMGSCSEAHKGVWKGKAVCVKLLSVEGAQSQMEISSLAAMWFREGVEHPNITKFYGGCHVGKPLFFVSELASEGNFVDYFHRDENNIHKVWRLFFQVAQGLKYLHSKHIVHGNLKCNNLLVDAGGMAQICHMQVNIFNSGHNEVKMQATDAVRWSAPEFLLEQGAAANPSFASDVYSLGMSIIEAKIGDIPWGTSSAEDVVDKLFEGEGFPRPERVFTDREWGLVQAMTAFDRSSRILLLEALETLAELAREEEESEQRIDAERRAAAKRQFDLAREEDEWKKRTDAERRAIVKTRGAEGNLGRLIMYIQNASYKDQEARDQQVQQVRQAQIWSKQETTERGKWEANMPTTAMCDKCGALNPLVYPFCFNCGSFVDGWRSREDAAFRFVAKNEDLEAAVQVLLELKRESAQQPVPRCSDCRAFGVQSAKFCGDCGSSLAHVDLVQPEKTSVQVTLRHEIDRLQAMIQRSSEEEARLALRKNDDFEVRDCGECGELNPEDEVFCRECGNDIEIARRHKKL